MNNEIIKLDDMTEPEQKERLIDTDGSAKCKMTMCPCGSEVFHKMHGCDNFRIDRMMDKNRHLPPQVNIKDIRIWFGDGLDGH